MSGNEQVKKEVDEEEEEEKRISRLLMGIMENYRDSLIPPLSDFHLTTTTATIHEIASCSKKRCRASVSANTSTAAGCSSLHKERDRREKMSEMFSALQSIVPGLFPKATRETIVKETIGYIGRLEEERKRLEGLKKKFLSPESMEAKPVLSRCNNRSSSVDVTVCAGSGVAFFGIQLACGKHLVTKVFGVFEKHRAEVLGANVAVDDHRRLTTVAVTAMVGCEGDGTVERIKRDILIL